MSALEDQFLDILQDIESALVKEYNANPSLMDSRVVFALDNAVIAVKQDKGYGKGRAVSSDTDVCAIIAHIREIGKKGKCSHEDYIACINQVKRSVERRRSSGLRAYFDFVSKYVG